jgi:hypothetical protein
LKPTKPQAAPLHRIITHDCNSACVVDKSPRVGAADEDIEAKRDGN